ncbi:MAG TPA: hypothetical protein VEX39_06140 [Thermoleophilaceae bacterium]|nr:hypothetical protein [Thermoleophilaceae bacterium]
MPVAAVAAASLLAVVSLVPSASAAKRAKPSVREFTGTVVSVGPRGKTFRLRRSGRPSVLVRVSRKTKLAKGAKPRKGRALVVKARREKKKGWLARSVRLVPVVVDEDEDLTADEPAVEEPAAGEDADEDVLSDLADEVDGLFGDEDGEGDESGEEPE